jgi:hypothetical protein
MASISAAFAALPLGEALGPDFFILLFYAPLAHLHSSQTNCD